MHLEVMPRAIHYAPNVVLQNFCQDIWQEETGLLLQLTLERIPVASDQIEKIT